MREDHTPKQTQEPLGKPMGVVQHPQTQEPERKEWECLWCNEKTPVGMGHICKQYNAKCGIFIPADDEKPAKKECEPLTPELLKKAMACEMCGRSDCGNMYRDKSLCKKDELAERLKDIVNSYYENGVDFSKSLADEARKWAAEVVRGYKDMLGNDTATDNGEHIACLEIMERFRLKDGSK